jgi:hypothetical protein
LAQLGVPKSQSQAAKLQLLGGLEQFFGDEKITSIWQFNQLLIDIISRSLLNHPQVIHHTHQLHPLPYIQLPTPST